MQCNIILYEQNSITPTHSKPLYRGKQEGGKNSITHGGKYCSVYFSSYHLLKGKCCNFVKINQYRAPGFVECFGWSSNRVFFFFSTKNILFERHAKETVGNCRTVERISLDLSSDLWQTTALLWLKSLLYLITEINCLIAYQMPTSVDLLSYYHHYFNAAPLLRKSGIRISIIWDTSPVVNPRILYHSTSPHTAESQGTINYTCEIPVKRLKWS